MKDKPDDAIATEIDAQEDFYKYYGAAPVVAWVLMDGI